MSIEAGEVTFSYVASDVDDQFVPVTGITTSSSLLEAELVRTFLAYQVVSEVSADLGADFMAPGIVGQVKWHSDSVLETGEDLDEPTALQSLVIIEGISRALDARIYESEGQVSIVDHDTGVFGTGQDLPSAVRDLRAALSEHLDVLAGDTSPLSAGLQHQLELLRSYFTTP